MEYIKVFCLRIQIILSIDGRLQKKLLKLATELMTAAMIRTSYQGQDQGQTIHSTCMAFKNISSIRFNQIKSLEI